MRVIPVSMLFMLVAAVAAAERPSRLEVVLDKHRAAIIEDPSKAAVESVQYDLTIEEQAFTVTADYRASRDGRMRIDVYDGETRVFSEGLGRDGGWQWPGGARLPEAIGEDGKAALRRGVVSNLYPLYERPALGYRLRLEGQVELDGQRFWKVASSDPDGFVETFFINADTGLIDRKTEVSALHPDQDATQQASVTYFSDYRPRGGRYFSFRNEKRAAGSDELLQAVTVGEIRINPGVDGMRISLPQGGS